MENYHCLQVEYLDKFILGGSSEFILSEKETKNHIDFHVKQDSKNKSLYWVRYKSIEWIYIGRILLEPKILFHPLKVNTNTSNEIIEKAEVFRKFILYIFYVKKIPSNLEVLYTGKCSICHRTLKNPTYIKIGIGPECLKKF
jgi:hypothetical protein